MPFLILVSNKSSKCILVIHWYIRKKIDCFGLDKFRFYENECLTLLLFTAYLKLSFVLKKNIYFYFPNSIFMDKSYDYKKSLQIFSLLLQLLLIILFCIFLNIRVCGLSLANQDINYLVCENTRTVHTSDIFYASKYIFSIEKKIEMSPNRNVSPSNYFFSYHLKNYNHYHTIQVQEKSNRMKFVSKIETHEKKKSLIVATLYSGYQNRFV